jgi:transcriptional regulator with PAS, ATPase and Fis domain
MRIGGQKVRSVDVRILAATNKDLVSDVAKGNFREDLFYRLNVFTIKLIPLRERKEDIPLLVEKFVRDICLRMGKTIAAISNDVIELLIHYCWPGNIRN